ncbi:hypothetical protein C5167_039860 [Papaver somniferum]|uniref:Uncharacterized protein n=1 Tax=Papaver somniferum TaxID=3469 RepID=A0A4Y7IHL0_PAPSO|nr:hypothetical protein C5167_039860 [Papaver somniferum]
MASLVICISRDSVDSLSDDVSKLARGLSNIGELVSIMDSAKKDGKYGVPNYAVSRVTSKVVEAPS